METYNSVGEVENGWVWFQLKATDSLKHSAGGTTVLLRLEWRDLLFWLNERWPVILVLYDAHSDQAYWLHVQEYFRRQRWSKRAKKATTVTVRIPTTNLLNEASVRLFAQFRDRHLRRK